MYQNMMKILLTFCFLFYGIVSNAASLNSVEVKTSSDVNRILIGSDYKTFAKKSTLSDGQIQLILKNTTIAENVKAKYVNASSLNGISLVQDGKDAYIYISGINSKNIELINTATNSIIPINTHKKDFGTVFGIISFVLLASLLSSFVNRKTNNSKHIKTPLELSLQQKELNSNLQIKEYRTIRHTVINSNSVSIHGNPAIKFASGKNSSVVSIPDTIAKKHLTGCINSGFYKKVVNS